MGAWGAGGFQNDDALDWVSDLRENGSVSDVREVLVQDTVPVPPHRPSFLLRLTGSRPFDLGLRAGASYKTIAAAEIVACWLGLPCAGIPESVAAWTSEHFSEFSAEFIELANQAVSVIETKSELKTMVEESGSQITAEWNTAIADLKNRLKPLAN